MLLTKALLLLLCGVILVSNVSISSALHTIYVDPQLGHDSASCHTNGSVCATLGYAVLGLTNSTKIILVNALHSINKTINFYHKKNVILSTEAPSLEIPPVKILCSNSSNAGLKFVHSQNVHMVGIRVENCGSLVQSTTRVNGTSMALFRAGVYVINSTNITIESCSFASNRGIGLVFFDTNGHIQIMNSNFIANSVPKEERSTYIGGGGLYIEYTYCTPGMIACDYWTNPFNNDSSYDISFCTFIDNHATTPPLQSASIFVYQQKTESRHLGIGGGLLIIVKGSSSGNVFSINECEFENNSAGFGGAVLISTQDHVRRNEFFFKSCKIENNRADFGGGGVAYGALFYEVDSIFDIIVSFSGINFTNNYSSSGGGAYVYASRSQSNEVVSTTILFSDCTWHRNRGTLGSAVLLAPDAFNTLTDGYLPVPKFTNCLFESNTIIPSTSGDSSTLPAVGALFSSTFTINFTSSVSFIGNNGTAISITAGSVNLLSNATVEFKNNVGVRGGALALLEFASLRLFSGSRVSFANNYARELGGAIFASAQDDLDFFFSRSCFIRYEDVTVPVREWNVHVSFRNNLAGPVLGMGSALNYSHNAQEEYAWGLSVYSVTILPCIQASDIPGRQSLNNSFPHGINDPYSFNEKCTGSLCSIATSPAMLEISSDQLDSDGVLKLSPGERRNLSIIAKDDLDNRVYTVVTASVFPPNNAHVDSASRFVTDSTVQVNGKLQSMFTMTLHTVGTRQISTSVKAKLISCPPGFVYQRREEKCVCSSTTAAQQYLGIMGCRIESFRGLLNKRYWAGCDINDSLLTAVCPSGYCRQDEDASYPFYVLPKTCQRLEEYICGPRNRKGRLCGECADNYTVFFHSEHYNCEVCKHSYLGWLFYILSELLPVTVVFLTVILLNVHITSGMWNSIILYAQIIDFIGTKTFESFDLPLPLAAFTGLYRLIYGSFNLDFFKFEALSFCLWDGATVMAVLMFRYLTAAYALFLLVLLLLSFKLPCWDRCQKAWERGQAIVGRSHHRDLVIHGISAFLVLSYAFCVKVSFQLLSTIQLHGEGSNPVKQVVILSGNIDYFGADHLPYALPAILILILTTLPPLLLITYPNSEQWLTACLGEQRMERVNECCEGKASCYRIQIFFSVSRFKPLFDSFQGCFRDKHRYFAGMFFVYRFLASLISAVSTDFTTFHATLEVLIVFMLAFHAFAQPYEKPLHNFLDTIMFANLALVNGLNLFGDHTSSSFSRQNAIIASVFQLILIYIPIILTASLWILFGVTRCNRKARHKLHRLNKFLHLFNESSDSQEFESEANNTIETQFDEDHLPHRMFEESVCNESDAGSRNTRSTH